MPPELREALEAAVTQSENTNATEPTTPTLSPESQPAPGVGGTEGGSPPAAPATGEEDGAAAKPAETKPAEGKPDEGGKPADGKPGDVGAAPTAASAAEKKAEADAIAAAKQHRVDRAPQSWKKDAKGEWSALPLHVRQEVHRREMEINRALEESAPVRQFAQEFQQTIAPFMARIQTAGVTPVQAVGKLFEADYILATSNPQKQAQYMAKLISDYGIDVKALDDALSAMMGGAQPQGQPQGQSNDIEQRVLSQVQQMLAPIINERQQAQQQVQQEAVMTVEQMSLNPKYPHFEEVRMDMADLIDIYSRRGIYLSLDDAYDRAIKMNPTVSAQLNLEAGMQHANDQHLQAQRAKTAASSVTGAPAGGGGLAAVGDGTLRGSIEAAFAGQRV